MESEDKTNKIQTKGGWATKFNELASPDNVDMFNNSHLARGDSLMPNELAKLNQQTIQLQMDPENEMLKTVSDKK